MALKLARAHKPNLLAVCLFSATFVAGQAQQSNATNDFADTLKWLRKDANHGNARAQWTLSHCYEHGEGVPHNSREGFQWLLKAASNGSADAQLELAYDYRYGAEPGVATNDAKAVEWYRKAARRGDDEAQLSLADCYANGTGVATNQALAAKWYLRAAKNGNYDAQYLIGLCYASGKGVAKDYSQAVKWLRETAEVGYGDAPSTFCLFYAQRAGVTTNKEAAAQWYRKAAERGQAEAQYYLGHCYFFGCGVPTDYLEASKWYGVAAKQGHVLAQLAFGNCYAFGWGVEQSDEEAVRWWQKAAKQGDEEARFRLSRRSPQDRSPHYDPLSWKHTTMLPRGPSIASLNAVAANSRADRADRAVAIFTLFARHIRPGSSAKEVHRVLSEANWLHESKLEGIYAQGGSASVETGQDRTVFLLRLFPSEMENRWSPWNICFSLPDAYGPPAPNAPSWLLSRTEREALEFLRGDPTLPGSPKLIEFTLCYPRWFRGRNNLRERFGPKGMHADERR